MICKKCGYETEFQTCECSWVAAKAPAKYALAVCKDFQYKMNLKKMVSLVGEPGVGKTHAAWAISKLFKYYFNKTDEIDIVYCQNVNKLPSALSATIEEHKKSQILIIDEYADFIYPLMDYRYSHGLITICTMNKLSEDDRTASRFGDGTIVGMTNASYRGTGKPEDLMKTRQMQYKRYLKWVSEKNMSSTKLAEIEFEKWLNDVTYKISFDSMQVLPDSKKMQYLSFYNRD